MNRPILYWLAFVGLAACASAAGSSSSGDITPGAEATGGRRCRPSVTAQSIRTDTVVTGEAPLLYDRIRPTPRVPRYPDDLKQRNVDGRVLASFIVDTLGRVVPGSESITQETERGFGDAVCTYLRSAHFIPFESGGRRKTVELRDQLTTFSLIR